MNLLRKFLDMLSQFLGKLKSKRRLKVKNQSITKINLGAGLTVARSWAIERKSLYSLKYPNKN